MSWRNRSVQNSVPVNVLLLLFRMLVSRFTVRSQMQWTGNFHEVLNNSAKLLQKISSGHLNTAGVRMRSLSYFYPCFRWSQCHNVLSQCSQCQVLSWLFQRAEKKKKKWKHLLLPTKSVSCLWNGCPRSQGQHTWADWEGGSLLWNRDSGKIWAKRLIVPSDTVPKNPKGWST